MSKWILKFEKTYLLTIVTLKDSTAKWKKREGKKMRSWQCIINKCTYLDRERATERQDKADVEEGMNKNPYLRKRFIVNTHRTLWRYFSFKLYFSIFVVIKHKRTALEKIKCQNIVDNEKLHSSTCRNEPMREIWRKSRKIAFERC